MDIHRSYYYYREKRDDTEVEEAIRSASEHGDGFWKIFERLRREGRTWNHKKVYCVYKKMHYERRSKLKNRLPARVKNPLEQPNESLGNMTPMEYSKRSAVYVRRNNVNLREKLKLKPKSIIFAV